MLSCGGTKELVGFGVNISFSKAATIATATTATMLRWSNHPAAAHMVSLYKAGHAVMKQVQVSKQDCVQLAKRGKWAC